MSSSSYWSDLSLELQIQNYWWWPGVVAGTVILALGGRWILWVAGQLRLHTVSGKKKKKRNLHYRIMISLFYFRWYYSALFYVGNFLINLNNPLSNLSRVHTGTACPVAYVIVKYWSQQLPVLNTHCFFGTREGIKALLYSSYLWARLSRLMQHLHLGVHSLGLDPSVFLW